MGNYEDHVNYAHATYALLTIALIGATLSGGLTPLNGFIFAITAYPAIRLGAAFPDIDHHASKPHHTLRKIVFFTTTITAILLIYTQPYINIYELFTTLKIGLNTPTIAALTIHLTALLLGVIARELISHFRPSHRGITHRLPTGLTIALTIALIGWYPLTITAYQPYAIPTASILGSGFFLGFLSHLQCDHMLLPAIQNTLKTTVHSARNITSR